MNDEYLQYRPPAFVPFSLSEDNQQELFNLLVKLLAGTKELKIRTIVSGQEDMFRLKDKMGDIGIHTIVEDYEMGNMGYRTVSVRFIDLLGYLLDFDKIKYDGGVNDE